MASVAFQINCKTIFIGLNFIQYYQIFWKDHIMQEQRKISLIQEAARSVFYESGYKEAKIKEIAKRATVSVGTVYLYFPSKKSLFDSLGLPHLVAYRPIYERRKKEIISIAIPLFAQKGYAKTTLEDIAHACGFSKAVLYQYFKGKEDLFRHIFHHNQISASLSKVEPQLQGQDIHTVFKMVGTAFLQTICNDIVCLNLIKIVLAETNKFPEVGQAFYSELVLRVDHNFVCILNKYFPNFLPQDQIEELVRSFFCMLFGLTVIDYVIGVGKPEFNYDILLDHVSYWITKNLQIPMNNENPNKKNR